MASKKMSPLKMQLAACCVLVLIATVAGAGCLSNDGGPPVCCQGRNNTCVRPGARVNDEQSRLCYCDDECLLTGDCCLDYKDVCQPVDCQLDDWTEWGECSALCGRGVMTRSRPVIVQPRNGGQACDTAVERLPCWGTKCKVSRAASGLEETRETGIIMPVSYGAWRQHGQYDPYKDHLRKNLYNQYHLKQNAIVRPAYYGLYKIIRSSPSCEQEEAPEWTKLLATKGTVVCVECQQYAMRKHLGERCHGHGSTQRETRWEASNGCRGTWQLISEHEAGSCEGDRDTSFILL